MTAAGLCSIVEEIRIAEMKPVKINHLPSRVLSPVVLLTKREFRPFNSRIPRHKRDLYRFSFHLH